MRFVPSRRHNLSKIQLLHRLRQRQHEASDTLESLQKMDQEKRGDDRAVETHTLSHGWDL